MAQGCASLGMCGMGAVCGLCMNRYNMRECVLSKKKNKKRKCGAWRLTPLATGGVTIKIIAADFFLFFFCLYQRTK